jgi:two-component system chemotaxis sensor kinase CheA
VLEHSQERVEQLARMVVLTDSGDLPGLVALQELAVGLAAELDEAHADTLAELARRIGDLARGIVLREVPDADAAFREIGALIERVQATVATATAEPGAGGPPKGAGADDELITAWIGSCEGMLSDLEAQLLALERSPNNAEVIGDIRRAIHTLKGECGVLSLHAVQRLCHEAESLIDARVSAGQPVPIDPFLKLLDWMKAYVARLSSDRVAAPTDDAPIMAALLAAQGAAPGPVQPPAPAPAPADQAVPTPPPSAAPNARPVDPRPPETAPAPPTSASTSTTGEQVADSTPLVFGPQPGTEENLADFLCEAREHIASSEEALLALDHDRGNTELINTVFRAFHTIKGVSGFMALTPIVALAHSAEQLLDAARSGTIALDRGELDLILASCDMMARLLGVLEGSSGPTRGEFQSLVQRLDQAAGIAGTRASPAPTPSTPPPAAGASAPPAQPMVEAKPEPAAPAPEPDADAAHAARVRKTDQTVKVNTTRIDNLVTMVGELVIAQQMVVQDVAGVVGVAGGGQRIQRTLSHMCKMIRDLQEVSMSLRMVNLKSTFQKMTRLVRDVSQKTGKLVDIATEGEDVELDRNVVEAITDPLVHMIRNACDHGIEGTEERRAAGKPPVGRVTLRAYHAGGSIVIEIADDGRGMHRDRILAKARSRGMLAPDADEASMPDSEVFGLIFLPGFSTAERVTDISGRGVGMDVVRRNIEALRGKIEIRSAPGAGTTFLLRLPLTMAIIDGMVVRVGTQRYVLPTLSIQQSFRPAESDIRTVAGVGEMVKVRGSMLPIYRLNRVLDLREGLDRITDALLIVMEADDARFCLMVDEIIGQQQVVIKSLTQTGQPLRGVSGGAILGDGRVALILDVAQVVGLARAASAGPTCGRRIDSESNAPCPVA